jgi:hypothetical protein
VAGLDQKAEDRQPGRVAQLLQTARGVIEFHALNMAEISWRVNDISRIIEIN